MSVTRGTEDRRYAILEAPSTLGLLSSGVEQLPRVLLDHGLAERLSATHAGRVEPASRGGQRDPLTTVLNASGFWIHVDADCLDDAVMPAVDFRLPGGLSPDELHTVVTTAIGSGRAVGIEVTIYNPALDPEHRAGKLLADVLARALSS